MIQPALPESCCQRILFCTDFSPSAEAAFDYALDAARRRPGAQLHLLHVIPETDAQFWKSYIYEVDKVDLHAKQDIHVKIKTAYLSRVPPGMTVTVDLRLGQVASKILEVAREQQADLIIIGRAGNRGGVLRQALLGQVAEKIVRQADCPVLVVPMGKSEIRSPKPETSSKSGFGN
jgi:nucleotide-binding universal stress UspA family protein